MRQHWQHRSSQTIILLNMDKRENEIIDGDLADDESAPGRDSSDRER